MKLRIEINIDNAAFEDNSVPAELAYIFARIQKMWDSGEPPNNQITQPTSISLRDSNGNRIGAAVLYPDET